MPLNNIRAGEENKSFVSQMHPCASGMSAERVSLRDRES